LFRRVAVIQLLGRKPKTVIGPGRDARPVRSERFRGGLASGLLLRGLRDGTVHEISDNCGG
jgi:hypothetical protein